MPTPLQNRALGYMRLSVEEAKTKSISFKVQDTRIQNYCANNSENPLDLIETLKDDGISGGIPLNERPEGAHLLELLISAKINHVVAYRLDRLFRNTSDALQVINAWNKAEIFLHLTDQGGTSIDTKSATGKFFFTLLASVGELEKNVIGERVKTALHYKKMNFQVYNHVPYGFTRKSKLDKRLYPNLKETAVLLQIKEWRQQGWSYHRIAATLNAQGVPTKKTGQTYGAGKNKLKTQYEGRWYAATVHYMLKHGINSVQPPGDNSPPLPAEADAPA